MSTAAVFLAAALATGSQAAPASRDPIDRVPAYPGGKIALVAGSMVVTTPDPLEKVKAGYTAAFRKAGWKPSAPDSVLNGDVPGAGKAEKEALSRAITYLSFERRGQTVDLFLAPGKDRQSKPITLITILRGPAPAADSYRGDRSGRP